MKRPLPIAYLDYAARDIELLARVYATFQARGHVSNKKRQLPELEVQSRRYVTLHDAPVPKDDMYRASNVLSLEILSIPAAGTTSECVQCHRRLSPESFTYCSDLAATIRQRVVHDTCKVCYLLSERATVQQQEDVNAVSVPVQSALKQIR